MTATGSDITTILRLVFADHASGNSVLSPVPISDESSAHTLVSLSGIGLFSLCCPLPLAVDDADFMSNLLFGFGSGSNGTSLGSGVAGADSGTAVTLSLLFFLVPP